MEIKHGPQGQGKVDHCSVNITSNLTLYFVTLPSFIQSAICIVYLHDKYLQSFATIDTLSV